MDRLSRLVAAFVVAASAGGAAWGTTISYPAVDDNNCGASCPGGKTITLNYAGTMPTTVHFNGQDVSTLLSRYGGFCTVTITGDDVSGTIDVEAPPQQIPWPDSIKIQAVGSAEGPSLEFRHSRGR